MNPFKTKIQNFFSKAFNLSVLDKSRMKWIDYLKGIAIFLVVYRHVLLGIERSGFLIPSYLLKANMIFFSFRMPLFFILSGIFISSSLAKRSLKKLISIKFENLFYPYLIWVFLQVTLQLFFGRFTNQGRSPGDYLKILYDPHKLDHFWYLPALFNTTAIYLILKVKFKLRTWQQFSLGLIFFFVSSYLQKVTMMSDWMNFYIFFVIGDTVSAFFFKKSSQEFLKNPLSMLCIIPIFIFSQLFYLTHSEGYYLYGIGRIEYLVIALTGCLAMFILSFRLQIWNVLTFLRIFGYHSLYIYVMHVMIGAAARVFLNKFLGINDPVILLFLSIAFAVTLPVVIYNFFIRENVGWFLFSYHKPKPSSKKAEKKLKTSMMTL